MEIWYLLFDQQKYISEKKIFWKYNFPNEDWKIKFPCLLLILKTKMKYAN